MNHSKSGPFENLTKIDHSKSEHQTRHLIPGDRIVRSWVHRPNPGDQINRKPEDQKELKKPHDQKFEKH